MLEEFYHIETPFVPDAWERELKACGGDVWEQYGGIVDGMRNGFKTGVENVSLSETYIGENKVKDEHRVWLSEQYDEETALGRLSTGYPVEEVVKAFGAPWTLSLRSQLISVC